VNARGLICIVTGHRWGPPTDERDGVVLLQCRRCEREQVFSAETFELDGLGERVARAEMAHNPFMDPRDADPKIRDLRRGR
jgi:hypothetical protein